MKSFSVVIPTLNESKNISNILSDISNQTISPKEIVVVDGFSKDKTRQIIKDKFPYVQLLSCPPNVSSQRNYGAKATTSKVIYFLDADTRLPNNNFFFKSVSQFTEGAACPYYLPYKSNFIILLVYAFFNIMFFVFQKISASGAGSALIINKSLFFKLNGFNQNTKFEDIELIRKASKISKFKMLNSYIWVSDRRFKNYGIIRTTIQYLLLSILFLFNQFNYSAGLSYQFGKYQKK